MLPKTYGVKYNDNWTNSSIFHLKVKKANLSLQRWDNVRRLYDLALAYVT